MTSGLIGTGWAGPRTTEVGSCRSLLTGETANAITAAPEPDTASWQMMLGSGLPRLYQDLRWPGWQDEMAASAGIRVSP